MCCSVTVTPSVPETLQTYLGLGQFTQQRPPYTGHIWVRTVRDTAIHVYVDTKADLIRLSLFPAIGSYIQHVGKREVMSVLLEVAARYAEKVNGTVVQVNTVDECRGGGEGRRLLAAYPEMPMRWEALCPGFRELFVTPLGPSL